MLRRFAGWSACCLIVASFAMISSPVTFAAVPQSNNYRFDESTLGSGGLVQSSSPNFRANSSASDLAVGNAASENFQVEAGSQTTHEPTLSFAINNADANFGSFSASTAATATATFSIANYTSYGYVVQITGDTPSNGDHVIPGMSETAPSQAGVEQFGINLVANTSPVSVGANPDHGEFGAGVAAPNYGTSNMYRYVNGETIATSDVSSGITTYTITYLMNVASLTPGGEYSSKQTLVVTGTY